MFDLFRKVFKLKPEEKKYNSFIDEYNRYCDAGYRIKLNVGPKLAFKIIVKASLEDFINKVDFENLKVGQHFTQKMPDNKTCIFEITKYDVNKVYEIKTRLNNNEYWTSFEMLDEKGFNCSIQFSQLVKADQTIDRIFNGKEKFKFRSQVGKKGKFLQEKFLNYIIQNHLNGKEIDDNGEYLK